jgi:hypothetical protein
MLIFGAPWHLPPAWGDIPTWITGVATAVLAVFAIVTAWYARQAFRKQSQEVGDQASMLKVQSKQLTQQRKINARQTKVLKLQARELRESLDERKREAEQRKIAQAAKVFVSKADSSYAPGRPVRNIRNTRRRCNGCVDRYHQNPGRSRRGVASRRNDHRELKRSAHLRHPTQVAPRLRWSRLSEPRTNRHGHAWR